MTSAFFGVTLPTFHLPLLRRLGSEDLVLEEENKQRSSCHEEFKRPHTGPRIAKNKEIRIWTNFGQKSKINAAGNDRTYINDG